MNITFDYKGIKMIDHIGTASNKHITIIPSPLPYINTTSPGAGALRYLNNTIEVNDGFTWIGIANTVQISLTSDTEQLLYWVKKKYDEELQEQLMMDKYPALANAKNSYLMIKQLCEAEEKLENQRDN